MTWDKIQQVQLDDTKDLRLLADEQKNTNEKVYRFTRKT